MNPRSHIFISYARSDGEAFARLIHQKLEENEHLTCWRDRLDLDGGESFWAQLEAGVSAARWALVVLTPGALRSEWTAKEWREARKHGVPICPVWPFTAKELGRHLEQSRLPAGMQRSHIYTPFPEGHENGARAGEEWRNLVATLRMEKDVWRAPFMAPPLPPDYVDRPAEVAEVTTSLMTGGITAMRGAAGMGKTTLAKAVAHADQVVDTFYDGILWVTLGTRPKLVEVIADLCRAVRDQDKGIQFGGLNTAESHLRGLLENRRCLLIIDDAWRRSDLQPFSDLGPSLTTLVTTRIGEVARDAHETSRIKIKQLTEKQAADVLQAFVRERDRRRVEQLCQDLANRLGRWPLLLRLAGAQVRRQLEYGETAERALKSIGENLRTRGATALDAKGSPEDFEDERMRDRAVSVSIGESLRLLGETERQSFLDLGVFPADIDIPLATAGQLWGLPDAKDTALQLAELSLIDLRLGEHGVIRLHDLILNYAAERLKAEKSWVDIHQRLLDAWRNPAEPPDDYAWRWVCYHLKEAGRQDLLIRLLFDYDAVASRLTARSVGVNRLAADYGLLDPVKDAVHLQRVFGRAAHILTRYPELLAQQLVGRITIQSPECQRLLTEARTKAPRHALLPRTASLASRSGVLRQVVRHSGAISRLVPTGDGRLVSSSEDGRVYCTRLEGGEPVVVAQHEGTMWQLRLTDDRRVVSGGWDGRVYCSRLDGSESVLLVRHEDVIWRLSLTGDGRVVSGAKDGRVYCAPLDGGDPVLLAQHQGGASHLALTGDGRVVSGGAEDGRVYCARLEGGEPVLLAQHEGWVGHLALTGDGRVVSGGKDGRVYCARLEGGEPVLLAQHEGSIRDLALTGDGRVVSSGDEDGRVYCSGLKGGEPVLLAQHEGWVGHLALTGDGRVVSGGKDGRVYCARLEGGEPVLLAQHEGWVGHLALTGDGRVVSSGDEDGRVYCAGLKGGEPVLLAQHEGSVGHLALTGDGRGVSGGGDGRVYCARLEGGEPVLLAQQEGWVRQLALTGDGRVVSSGGEDSRVYCARLEGGAPVLLAQHDDSVTDVVLTDDEHVVSGGKDGRVYWARLDAGEPVVLLRHEGAIERLSLTSDGHVVSGGKDGRVYCTRLEGGEPVLLAKHDGAIEQLMLTGDRRVVSGAFDGRVYCAHLDGGEPVLLAQHEGGGRPAGPLMAFFDMRIWWLELTGDGRVVSAGRDGRVYCARLEGGEPVLLVQNQSRIWLLWLTGDGRVVSSDEDGRVYCARLEGGEPVLLAQHRGMIWGLAVTGDGRVVSGGVDGRVYCARLEGGEPALLAQYEGSISKLRLTGDGRVVSVDWDGRVYCVRLEGGAPVLLARHEGAIEQLALTDDGHVVSGGKDGRVYLARLEGGEPVLLARHEGAIEQLALTDDGHVVSGGKDGRVYLARLEGGAPVLLARHEGAIEQLALTDDGHVVSGGKDGRVYLARLEGGEPVLLAQHEGAIKQLELTGDGRLLSTGDDATIFVTDLSAAKTCGIFVSDLTPTTMAFSAAHQVFVAGDVSGSLHIIPLDNSERPSSTFSSRTDRH